MKYINEEDFIRICNESQTAAEAATKLGIAFSTFKRKAIKLGCYNTNQSGKGKKKLYAPKYLLEDILAGKHPEYNTYKLKNRLFKAGIKENKCEECGIANWRNKHISCELDHMDGNPRNHLLDNLRIICPNCHSQTETFRSKIRK